MNATPYLNLIEGDTIARRTETATRFDLLRREIANATPAPISIVPSKFSLAGTPFDAALGQLVTIKVTDGSDGGAE